MKPSQAYTLNDFPTDKDTLDFTPYVDSLVDIIISPTTDTPLTIGIFGTWGSGKTSLMLMMRKRLPKSFRTTWFNAWMYDKEETVWRAFLLSTLVSLKEAIPNDKPEDIEKLERLKMALYQPVTVEKLGGITVEWDKLGYGAAESAVQVGLSILPGGTIVSDLLKELRNTEHSEQALTKIFSSIQRERVNEHIEQVRFSEQFQKHFTELADEYLIKKNLRLVIFIDDLDRCLPEKAVETLEAIKLFLDTPGCVFVIGADQSIITQGIEIKYADFENGNNDIQQKPNEYNNLLKGTRYLEKIIQLPFQIPPIDRQISTNFVNSLVPEWPHPACPQIFAMGLEDNPRLVKRTVNVFLLLWNLAQKRFTQSKHQIKPARLAKIVTIQAVAPELYSRLKESPRFLRDLENYYTVDFLPASQDNSQDNSQPDRKRKVELNPTVASFSTNEAVHRILTLHPLNMPDVNFSDLTPNEIRSYFTLTRNVEMNKNISITHPRIFFEPQTIHIPAGNFLMGSTQKQVQDLINSGISLERIRRETPQHTVNLSDYRIGKYLITNHEYQAFIRDVKLEQPVGWQNHNFPKDKGDFPVVNVTWKAANEYCEWLSEQTNKNYRLPTEAEWEKASRGTDGRLYPWGNQFNTKYCNTAERKIGRVTPLGHFSPQGDSPYECVDMSGNIWEWCSDWFNTKEYKKRTQIIERDPKGPKIGKYRVLRGGSFIMSYEYARCSARYRMAPSYWYDFGFRVAMGE